MPINWIIFACLYLVSGFGNTVYAYDHVVSEQRDHKVTLTCPIDFKACGELHSVKWFKGNTRIAVVSGDGEVATVKDEYMSRMSIDHLPKGPATRLAIKSLQIADEDVYTCESTFLEPRESCDTSGAFRIELKIEVPPSAIHILDENGKFVKNATKYGPLREGDTLKSICEVKGTRPVPSVAWFRGGKRLTDSLHVDEANGLFSVKSELLLVLSRLELGNNIECRVESPSLYGEIVSNHLLLDLEVRPTKINLTGVEHHTVQGTNVLLQCKVSGARPAVNIAWYNSTHLIDIRQTELTQIETKSIEQRDGTYETISDLKFTATRFENDAKFRCEAQNVVMKDNKEKPLHQSLVLEVLYPPVVTVKPENLTVTEYKEVLLFCEYEANPASLVSVKWYQNGKLLNLSESKRYEGGNAEHTALLIKETLRTDDGVYTCELGNTIGSELSESEINVEVHFSPVVNITMEPDTPIIENEESNVTLYCNVIEGNPPNLVKVRWFLEGDLLKELPECNSASSNDGGDDLCNIDPSKLLLQNIGRQFLGNYSCEGFNSAGWGTRSKENELIVYYEPGNATIRHDPQIAIKKKSVSFSCSVDDAGYPKATTFHWLRGGRVVHEVTSNQYTVDPVGLDCRTNFTCYAYNAGGSGNSATVLLDVHAAPTFINPLMPYTGVLFSTDNASLTCRVECVPECSIVWLKDGVGIDEPSDKYFITQTYLGADPATGDFESVLSVLNFNMSAWPQGKFDIYGDNANYSCASTNNSAGPGVRSATYFGIEYPPENTTVSNDVVTVEEDNIPERILCSAKANPEPSYEWRFKDGVISRSNALLINRQMAKSDAGIYECISFNKHGRHSATTNITVTYKPTCEIVRKDIGDEDTLICTAVGNPVEADFQWSIKSENDSIDLGNGRIDGESSFLALNDEFSITRIYRCVANNSVGAGPFCQIEVAGHLAWYQRWDKITLIILVASVLGVLLAVIALCCIIICICRRRRRRDKYHTDVSISATQSVLSYQASPQPSQPAQNASTATHQAAAPEIPKSPPKWPLRPGVMVHVKGNTKQNLCANRTNVPTSSANVSIEIAQTEAQLASLSQPLTTLIVPTRRAGNGLQVDPGRNGGGGRPAESIIAVPDDKRKAIHHPKRKLCSIHVGPNNNILIGEETESRPPPLPKRNILASRNSTNANNISECSANELLPRKSKKRKNNNNLPSDNDDDDDSTIGCRPLQGSNDAQEASETGPPNTGLFEKIFGEIFNRQARNDNDERMNFGNRFRNLFGMSRIFGRHRLERSDSGVSNPFANEHRLKGIRCSGGVVTYKKTPVLKRPALDDSTRTALSPVIVPRNEQINGKSSALGDPLTEPGEYENLPFHGLQTAPNKFVTTPSINFNNTNVVRVAPRPKQVTNNQLNTKHQQQQQNYQLQQNMKQSYPMASSQTLLLSSSTSGNGGANCNTTGHSRNYNLSNCFPTSYTAYYEQQQQHKCQTTNKSHPENSFTNNCPYTVENQSSATSSHNPFIVQNLRKFNTNSGCRQGGHRKKPPDLEKKFYSLKSLANRKGVGLHFCSMKPSLSSNKCKRHHSFAGGSVGDIVTGGITSHTLPFLTPEQNHTKMKFYEPPLYENLTDSIQIHESSIGNGRPYKQHRQHQHQLNDDGNNLMEPERLSIYRSDSGISNSSYECVTPVPAPRQLLQQKKSSHSSKCPTKSPLYMNVNNTSSTLPSSSSLAQSNHPCPNASSINSNNNSNGNSHCNGANKCNPTHNNSKDKQHPCQQQQMQHARHGSSNRKCKTRSQNSSSLLSLERVSNTNPFLAAGASSSSGFNSINGQGGGVSSSSSSSTNRCRQNQQQQQHQQQPQMPKDLFSVPLTPSSSSSSQSASGASNTTKFNHSNSANSAHLAATNYNSDNSLTNHDTRNHKTNGYVIRPMKLPLRKHHSFHFQPSQTVAGAKTKQQNSSSISISSSYKMNGGPLVFKPLLNEKSAFKPITPANSSRNCNRLSRNGNNANTPRICGTSLKRHMSNVESYDGSRYRIQSLSSPRLSVEDEEQFGDDDDDIDDDDDVDVEEVVITQEEDLPSSSSNSTIVGKRLVYADLAPFNSSIRSNRNLRTISNVDTEIQHDENTIVDEFDDLTINSDSEQFRRSNSSNNRLRQIPYNTFDSRSNDTTILATPTKRTTQYATLKFNEPLSPADLADDLDYADVDYRSYGPINYKAASIYALVKKDKNKDNGALKEIK